MPMTRLQADNVDFVVDTLKQPWKYSSFLVRVRYYFTFSCPLPFFPRLHRCDDRHGVVFQRRMQSPRENNTVQSFVQADQKAVLVCNFGVTAQVLFFPQVFWLDPEGACSACLTAPMCAPRPSWSPPCPGPTSVSTTPCRGLSSMLVELVALQAVPVGNS